MLTARMIQTSSYRYMIPFLFLHVPVVALACWFVGTDIIVPTGLAFFFCVVPFITWRISGEASVTRFLIAVSFMLVIALLVYAFKGHPWQIDIHMYFFAGLAMLMSFLDWRVYVLATTTVVLHHLSLNYIMPIWVFPGGQDDPRVVLHAVIVVIEAVILTFATGKMLQALKEASNFANEVKEASHRLEKTEERYRLTLQGVNDGIFDWDIGNSSLFLSDRAKDIFAIEDVGNWNKDDWFSVKLLPEQRAKFFAAVRAHLKGEVERFEFDAPYEIHGNVHRWISLRGLALRDPHSGECHRMLGSVSDISARKMAEEQVQMLNANLEKKVEERTQELTDVNKQMSRTLDDLQRAQRDLVEAEKMASLGGLVSGIAHEVNTPIGISVTAASHLQDQIAKLEEKFSTGALKKSDFENFFGQANENGQITLNNLNRAANLIRSFKQVAIDQSSEEIRDINLREYIEEVALNLTPKLKKTKITLSVDADDNIMMHTYPGALAQIFTNLIMNSLLHAYQPNEEGEILITATQQDEEIHLFFSDDGCGMGVDVAAKVFEPFYTTKRGQGGSGLGMNIVYNLATQRLKGKIECESILGEGTTYKLVIPVSAK